MKYCGYCGNEMPKDMFFCPTCGKKQDTNNTTHTPPLENTADKQPTKKRKTRKSLIIVSFVIAVLSVITAIVLFYPKSFSENTSKINNAAQSVVMLSCYDDSDNLVATGSGFIAISDDIVITNFHVIDYSLKIRVSTEQDKSYEVDKVLAYDENSDVAILKLSKKTGLSVLPLGNSGKINKGDKITAIGSPLGIKNTVSTGVLSGRYWSSTANLDVIQFTAPISSGSSGGALFDETGNVIGVTYASFTDGQNLNLAIPIEQVNIIYNAKGTAITLSELCEKEHPGYSHYLGSQNVQYSELVKNPDKYNGKTISVVGYAATGENGWGAALSEILLLPTEEYVIWDDLSVRDSLLYRIAPFKDSHLIICRDERQSKLTEYMGKYVIVTGTFKYDNNAKMNLLYVDTYEE